MRYLCQRYRELTSWFFVFSHFQDWPKGIYSHKMSGINPYLLQICLAHFLCEVSHLTQKVGLACLKILLEYENKIIEYQSVIQESVYRPAWWCHVLILDSILSLHLKTKSFELTLSPLVTQNWFICLWNLTVHVVPNARGW